MIPQSWTKYLQTFSLFSAISHHHKWNGTILLSPESEIAERRKTEDLRKFQEIPEIFRFHDDYPAGHPKAKF